MTGKGPFRQGRAVANHLTNCSGQTSDNQSFGRERRISEMANGFTIEFKSEDDCRWLAGIRDLLGVLAYGISIAAAGTEAEVSAAHVLIERFMNQD